MNGYEVRKQIRQTAAKKRYKVKKEIKLLERDAAECRYIEAFKLHFGVVPKTLKSKSTEWLVNQANILFAAAHEKELENDDG